MPRHEPPRLLAWLVSRLVPRTLRESVLGDLAEDYARRAESEGPAAARRHYRREAWSVARALGAFSHEPTQLTPPRGPLDGLGADCRFAWRLYRRRPLAAGLIVTTLGLAIGGSTAIFTVLKPTLLDALPYPHGGRLVLIWEAYQGGNSNLGFTTLADVGDRATSLDRVAAVGYWRPTWLGQGEPVRLIGQKVTHSFFGMLGVAPALGRDFRPDDDRPNAARVAIVSHRLWRERMGADPAAVGRAISLGGEPVVVVGVLPDDFESLLGPDTEIWAPLGYDRSLGQACRSCRHLRALGRIATGRTLAVAAGEVEAIGRRLATEFPREYGTHQLVIEPLKTQVTKESRGALWLLFGAVALVLGVACANVANLLLGQAVQRRQEFAVRMALGSGRDRLARQVVIEAVMLGLAGAVVALGLTAVSIGVIRSWAAGLPRAAMVQMNWEVLLFGSAVGLAAGLGFGLLPARTSLEAALEGLRQGGRVTARRQVRRMLVVTEVALASVLVVGTMLLVRSMNRLLAVDPGFQPDGLITADLQTAGPAFRSDSAVWRYYEAVRARVAELPGVTSVALASQLPLGGGFDYYGVRAASRLERNPDDAVSAARYAVTPGYFETMGIGLVAGRTFTTADRAGAPLVAVVNRHYADHQFPGRSPLGERIAVGGGPDGDLLWRTIVGVVGDVRQQGLDDPLGPQVYLPNDQWIFSDDLSLVARTERPPESFAAAVRATVRSIHPDPTIQRVLPMTAVIGEQLTSRRLVLRLFGAFGVLSLVIAAVGVYGVMAGTVAERYRELGIRAAIGASAGRLRRAVLGESALLGGIGLVLGGTVAALAAKRLGASLYGFQATDPVAFATTAVVLLGAVVLAAWVPAARAARLDPATVIRTE